MRILGINCLNHDAAMAVVDGKEILWAAHAERYSKIKNDQFLNWNIVNEALSYSPDLVVYYEKPWLKKLRQLRAGQYGYAFDMEELPSRYLKQFGIKIDEYVSHHHSHMAGGYYTAPFKDADILTIDAIGEFETITLWNNEKKVKSWSYPYSLGLLYSAMTQRIGLKPNEEEYIDRLFPACKNISIDYGIMEKSDKVYVYPASFGWSDLGTWGSLYTHLELDDQGNAMQGNKVMLYDSTNNIINMPKDKLVVLQGLEGYIIVESDGNLLICKKENEQQIKQFVIDAKKKQNSD